jgi:hypothetical protein
MEELRKKTRDWEEEGRRPPPFSPTAAAGSDGGGTGKKGDKPTQGAEDVGCFVFVFFQTGTVCNPWHWWVITHQLHREV